MDKLNIFLNDEKVKGVIAIVVAIVMYWIPDHIDAVIETLLAAFGIEKLVIKKE